MYIRGVIANYCPLSYFFFVVSTFWQRLIYQMKAESFSVKLISNIYMMLDHIVIYHGLCLAVNKCAFLTMNGGTVVTFFLTNPNFILIENIYDPVIHRAENDLDAGLHVFGMRDIGLSL